MAIDSSLTTIEKTYTGSDSDVGSNRVFITTSNSLNEWRQFTNRVAQDLENLMDEVENVNRLGAPATNPVLTGTVNVNNLRIDSNTFTAVRTDTEQIRARASASDGAIPTEKSVARLKDDLQANIDLKSNIANPSFTGNVDLSRIAGANSIIIQPDNNVDGGYNLTIQAGRSTNSAAGTLNLQAGTEGSNSSGPGDINIGTDEVDRITIGTNSANYTVNNNSAFRTAIGLGNVTNESKSTMFTSPAFTGSPSAPTPATNINGTRIATTAFSQALVAEKITDEFETGGRLENIDNTSDADKPISTAAQAALDLKAPKASPTFTGNVIAATAPTATNHLTNKSYVDTQVDTKDNYNHWKFRVNSGTINNITTGETLNFSVQNNDTSALEFVRTNANTVSLSLDLAELDHEKDGRIPQSVLPSGASGIRLSNINPIDITASSESFLDSNSRLMTAAAIDDRIISRIAGAINEDVDGTFIDSATTATFGLDVSVTGGDLLINLDMNELQTNATSDTLDYFIIGHRTSGTSVSGAPQRMKFGEVHVDHLDYVNKIDLDELGNVSNNNPTSIQGASGKYFLRWNGSEWIGDTLAERIALDELNDVDTTGVMDGHVLVYSTDGNPQRWQVIPRNALLIAGTTGGAHTLNLSELASDVNYSSAANGTFLKRVNGKWTPSIDNNTTYNATANSGITETNNTFGLTGYADLNDNHLMMWNDTNNKLVNSEITYSSSDSEFSIGNNRLRIQRDGDGTQSILIGAVDGSPAGAFTVVNAPNFSGTTRKGYIAFGRDTNSNDGGIIYHETGISSDLNEGVLHLCPSDDNSGAGDYVAIHGHNDAIGDKQVRLFTDGSIRGGKLDIYPTPTGSSGTVGTQFGVNAQGVVTCPITHTSNKIGGRLRLQKPILSTDSANNTSYDPNTWSIQIQGDNNEFQLYSQRGGDSDFNRQVIAINEETGKLTLPQTEASDITGDHDVVTLEKMVAYTDERIALKLFGPRPRFDVTWFFESLYASGDDGDYYTGGNNAELKFELFDLAEAGFQKHEDTNKYYIKVDVMASRNSRYGHVGGYQTTTGNARTRFNPSLANASAVLATTADDYGLISLRSGLNIDYIVRSGDSDEQGVTVISYQVRFTVVITDLVTNRMYETMLPVIRRGSGTNSFTTRWGAKIKHFGGLPSTGAGGPAGRNNVFRVDAAPTVPSFNDYYGGQLTGSFLDLD
jgi:hypothetical protein